MFQGTRLVPFSESEMGRSALLMRLDWAGRRLTLLNTHSESGKVMYFEQGLKHLIYEL